jgi:ribosomal protein L37AE/L43A
MITMHEQISSVRATSKPTREGFTCQRCGTHNRRGTSDGCPWCADCRAVIALDPTYLTLQNTVEEAQELLDKWINNRRGARRHQPVLAV